MKRTQESKTEVGPEGSIFLSERQYARAKQGLLLGRGPVAMSLADVSEADVLEFMVGHDATLDMRARLTQQFRPDIWGEV